MFATLKRRVTAFFNPPPTKLTFDIAWKIVQRRINNVDEMVRKWIIDIERANFEQYDRDDLIEMMLVGTFVHNSFASCSTKELFLWVFESHIQQVLEIGTIHEFVEWLDRLTPN